MEFLIFGLPIVALLWLITAIIQFCMTNKENIEKRKALKKRNCNLCHSYWSVDCDYWWIYIFHHNVNCN